MFALTGNWEPKKQNGKKVSNFKVLNNFNPFSENVTNRQIETEETNCEESHKNDTGDKSILTHFCPI